MSHVLVIDQDKRPLEPIHPGYARKLLSCGKAAVYRRFPFVLILTRQVPEAHPQPLRLKIDPGSHTTGLAVLDDTTGHVLWAAELTHRGEQVRTGLQKRAAVRRGRRFRHRRYRPARFRNRRRSKGWLPPSLRSRVQHVEAWTRRLMRWCPLGAISYEAVRFDTQALHNPEIVWGWTTNTGLWPAWRSRNTCCSNGGTDAFTARRRVLRSKWNTSCQKYAEAATGSRDLRGV